MSSTSRGILFMLGVLLATLALAACATEDTSTPTSAPATQPSPVTVVVTATPGPSPTPVVVEVTPMPTIPPNIGGTMVIVSQEGDFTYPPRASADPGVMIWSSLFHDTLTDFGNGYEALPNLAESWEVVDNGLTYVFNLRPDVKWHDGQPFTANDVKFSLEAYAHPDEVGSNALREGLGLVKGYEDFLAGNASEISGIRVTDDMTVRVEVNSMYAAFLEMVGSSMHIFPKHVWEDIPISERPESPMSHGDGTIGTGAFIVESWTEAEKMIMNANEDYHFGRPNFDQVVYRFVAPGPAESATRFAQLKVGQIHALGAYSRITEDQVPEAESTPNLQIRRMLGLLNNFVDFNTDDPILSDKRVRQALSYATTRQNIANAIYAGNMRIINSAVPPAYSWAYNPAGILFDDDLDKAAQLLEDAGWQMGSDGIREKGGQKLQVTLSSPPGFPYVLILQQDWRRAGVEVELENIDWGSYWTRYFIERDRQAYAFERQTGVWTNPEFSWQQIFNVTKWQHPRKDELIRATTSTLDRIERQRAYYELQEVSNEDAAFLWMGMGDDIWAFDRNLVIPERPTGYLTLRDMRNWHFR